MPRREEKERKGRGTTSSNYYSPAPARRAAAPRCQAAAASFALVGCGRRGGARRANKRGAVAARFNKALSAPGGPPARGRGGLFDEPCCSRLIGSALGVVRACERVSGEMARLQERGRPAPAEGGRRGLYVSFAMRVGRVIALCSSPWGERLFKVLHKTLAAKQQPVGGSSKRQAARRHRAGCLPPKQDTKRTVGIHSRPHGGAESRASRPLKGTAAAAARSPRAQLLGAKKAASKVSL